MNWIASRWERDIVSLVVVLGSYPWIPTNYVGVPTKGHYPQARANTFFIIHYLCLRLHSKIMDKYLYPSSLILVIMIYACISYTFSLKYVYICLDIMDIWRIFFKILLLFFFSRWIYHAFPIFQWSECHRRGRWIQCSSNSSPSNKQWHRACLTQTWL